jgi:hypothetical protein
VAAFATPDDLIARWRALSADEWTRAETLLEDAASIIRVEVPDIDTRLADVDDPLDANLPRQVSCAMVRRAMVAGDMSGVTSQSETVGSFTQQIAWSNPSGDLYLTRKERNLLGGSAAQKAFVIDLIPAGTTSTPVNWFEIEGAEPPPGAGWP